MSKDNYTVGYGKPPKSGQFRPGHSGNPKGRPPGTKNLKTDLKEEAELLHTITHQGKQVQISQQRIVVKRLYEKAMQGDVRAIERICELTLRLFGIEGSEVEEHESLAQEDQDIIQGYLSRKSTKKEERNHDR